MHHHLTTWFLVLLMLLQMVQADQNLAHDCREYCLQCGNRSNNYQTPNASMQGPLEVSLQVTADGELPLAQITLHGSEPSTYIAVYHENVTVSVDGVRVSKYLILAKPQPAFSWITLVLAPAGQDTLLVYTPKDRLNVISADTKHHSLVSMSSSYETHVAFNCLTGCLIRTTSSVLVGRGVPLQPPLTMYLNPKPSITPVLILTSDQGNDKKTVDARDWTPDKWYRVKVEVGKDDQEQDKVKKPQLGKDGVNETQILVTDGNYTLTRLEGFSWTLHCIPEELMDTLASSASPDPEGNTEEASESTPAPETEVTGGKGKQTARGAGAQQVAAWVMAGLALFLVMVLALALCTKTARPAQAPHVYDSQPSVGVVYWKGATREPDEDSEPESPNELTVPAFRNSLKQPATDCKIVD